MLRRLLVPDRVFDTFKDLTPAFLMEKGIVHILSDIDNTLAPYEEALPSETVREWVKTMQDHGIEITLLSNNHHPRVSLFADALGLPFFCDAHKPLTGALKKAMAEKGSTKDNTCVLGDQLLTDVCAGKVCGLEAYFVPPIKDKTHLFQRFKRWLEKPYLRLYRKRAMAASKKG